MSLFKIVTLFCSLLIILGASPTRELEKHLKNEKQIRKYMLEIAKDIGVTCQYCHNLKNYKDTKLKTYQTGKKHIELVKLINHSSLLDKKTRCVICHMESPKPPAYK